MAGLAIGTPRFSEQSENAARKILKSQDDSEISCVLEAIDVASGGSAKNDDEADRIPQEARIHLNALSRSGRPADQRTEFASLAGQVWED